MKKSRSDRGITNSDVFTGIAVSNPTSREASVTFAAFQADGAAFQNPRTVTIPPGGRYARQLAEIFQGAGSFNGWVQATSATPGLTGFFLNANLSITDVDGAASSAPVAESILPIASENAQAKTELTLVNVNSESAAVTATLYAVDGAVIAAKDLTLNGHALIRQTLQPVFGDVHLANASHVRIRSDRPVAGHEVVVNFEIPQVARRRETIAVAGQPATAAQTYILPQFVTGGGWSSYLSVVNGSGLAQDVTLTAYKEGQALGSVRQSKRISLQGNGSIKATVEQFFRVSSGAAERRLDRSARPARVCHQQHRIRQYRRAVLCGRDRRGCRPGCRV